MGNKTTQPGPDLTPVLAPELLPEVEVDDAEEPETGPLRRCLVTRERLPKDVMLRFVLSPDREVVPDLSARLPGRGMWLSARADVLERAATRGAFAKAARGPVHVLPDLRARIETGLHGRVRDLVGLARRAGQAVSGWQAALEWLQKGRAALLVQASDGSAAERARLVGLRQVPAVTPRSACCGGAGKTGACDRGGSRTARGRRRRSRKQGRRAKWGSSSGAALGGPPPGGDRGPSGGGWLGYDRCAPRFRGAVPTSPAHARKHRVPRSTRGWT